MLIVIRKPEEEQSNYAAKLIIVVKAPMPYFKRYY